MWFVERIQCLSKKKCGRKGGGGVYKIRYGWLYLRFPPQLSRLAPGASIYENRLVNRKMCFYIFITLTCRINDAPHILPHITTCQSNCTIQPPSELRKIADMMKDRERNENWSKDEVLTIVSQLEIIGCEVKSL
jgi:hypothetical protein